MGDEEEKAADLDNPFMLMAEEENKDFRVGDREGLGTEI